MKLKSISSIFIFLLLSSCVEQETLDKVLDALDENKLPVIEKGVPFNTSGVTRCQDLFPGDHPDVCLVFNDSFEREDIVGAGSLEWDKVIMDNGRNGSNVDAEIATSDHLGGVSDGEKAVLFRGREGGSTHEIYLVTKPVDLSGYDQIYIQFDYLPIHLEQEIQLSWSSERVPENIRIEVCHSDDHTCGLTGSNSQNRLRDPAGWDRFYQEELEFGRNNNIRNYVQADWKLGQNLIDLAPYQERIDKMVFKITVSLDEGYDRNNRANQMDDGLILDNFILVGVNGNILF